MNLSARSIAVLVATCSFGLLLSGCQRKVCELSGRLPAAMTSPSNAFWTTHKDLIAPGARICEVMTAPTYEAVEYDFEREPSLPMLVVMKHVDGLGWTRTEQKHDEDSFEIFFLKDGIQLGVHGRTEDRRTHVTYSYAPARR